MNDYELRRAEQIKRNQALLQELGVQQAAKRTRSSHAHRGRGDDEEEDDKNDSSAHKRRKIARPPAPAPTRASARLKAVDTRPEYNEDRIAGPPPPPSSRRRQPTRPAGTSDAQAQRLASRGYDPRPGGADSRRTTAAAAAERFGDLDELRAGWISWVPSAPEPARDGASGEFSFADHRDFRPNLSPAEVLQQGAFGGTYFRPYRSRALGGLLVTDDWRELPRAWLEGLDVARFVCAAAYDPAANKYGVACGQSIEEWEAAGWIDHRHDVRGWFQWYCRFFQGRRCPDDERQISRWRKCVGETGRWRRILLKRYVALGIRTVTDEGDDDAGEEHPDVSPAVHQTCHHWAYQVRQEALDRWWAEGI